MKKTTAVRRPRLSAEQRRESILDAAVEVFATNGYRAGKVSHIAAKVGVTEPVIFQNFGTKADLYAAVLDRAARDIRADLQTLINEHGSASQMLAHVLNPGRGARRHPSQLHAALFTDAAALATEPALAGPARRAVRAVADHLAEIVRRGQSDRDINPEVNPEAAAWLLLSVLAGRSARSAAMPNHDRLEHAVCALALHALGLTVPARAAHREHADHGHPHSA